MGLKMGQVIFHVGPEKTGSTLVQNYFELNAENISDLEGRSVRLLSPLAVRDSGLLAEAQAVINTSQGEIPSLQKLLLQAGAGTTIISHESLFGHPDSAGFYGSKGGRRRLIELMVEGTAEHDPGFVFYYKPPHRLLESYYRHHVTHGGRLSVMEYLAKVPLLEMSFSEMRNDIMAAVGESRVRMLDAVIDNPEAFFRRFCAALGLVVGPQPLKIPSETNRSWTSLQIELARIANGRMSPAERSGWLRAMANLRIGEASDAPFVPAIVTQLVEQLYADEDRGLRGLMADVTTKRLL